jgi:hypothetical protein
VTSTLHADSAKSRPSYTSSPVQLHQLAGPATPARWSSHTSSLVQLHQPAGPAPPGTRPIEITFALISPTIYAVPLFATLSLLYSPPVDRTRNTSAYSLTTRLRVLSVSNPSWALQIYCLLSEKCSFERAPMLQCLTLGLAIQVPIQCTLFEWMVSYSSCCCCCCTLS